MQLPIKASVIEVIKSITIQPHVSRVLHYPDILVIQIQFQISKSTISTVYSPNFPDLSIMGTQAFCPKISG